MSTPKDTGGPAFPTQKLDSSGCPMQGLHGGMTLRDYFAAKALQAILESSVPFRDGNGKQLETWTEYAIASYAMSDAMLAERSKP